jgi:hypothetical protein
MAFTKTWGYTEASDISGRSIVPKNLSFGTDFTKASYTPGEAILANLTSPLDRVESVRFAVSPVANIYSGTKLDPSNQAQNKRGTNVLCQLRSCMGVIDDETNQKIILPFEAHIVVRIPQHEAVDFDDFKVMTNRLFGCLYEDGATKSSERINALMHGSVLPKALS